LLDNSKEKKNNTIKEEECYYYLVRDLRVFIRQNMSNYNSLRVYIRQIMRKKKIKINNILKRPCLREEKR
jgi:hypothetical protein